jgi:hypothetical protein
LLIRENPLTIRLIGRSPESLDFILQFDVPNPEFPREAYLARCRKSFGRQ